MKTVKTRTYNMDEESQQMLIELAKENDRSMSGQLRQMVREVYAEFKKQSSK